MPLIFPGDTKTYNASWEICSAKGLGKIFEWGIEKNEVFNYTSGNPFKWKDVWPKLGKYFDMEIEVKKRGFSIVKFFNKNGGHWQQIVKKYDLKNYEIDELVNPSFFESSMILDWDVIYSMEKAKRFGFNEEEEPTQIFIDLFNNLKERKVIPAA
jgi:predicted RNA-binding protein (virulence factor B family)